MGRHGFVAAVWMNTWVAVVVVMAWIVIGFVVTGGRGAPWIAPIAVVLAIVTPVAAYPVVRTVMLAVLYRLDPPEESDD